MLGGLLIAAADTEGNPSLAWRSRHAVQAARHDVALATQTAKASGKAGAAVGATVGKAAGRGRPGAGQGRSGQGQGGHRPGQRRPDPRREGGPGPWQGREGRAQGQHKAAKAATKASVKAGKTAAKAGVKAGKTATRAGYEVGQVKVKASSSFPAEVPAGPRPRRARLAGSLDPFLTSRLDPTSFLTHALALVIMGSLLSGRQ